MNTEKIFPYALVIVLFLILYKLTTFIVYSRIKKKLMGADLYTFTIHLGDDYVYRFLSDEIKRYKWKKGLLIIKASFDKEDKLVSNQILSFNIFSFFIRVNFI